MKDTRIIMGMPVTAKVVDGRISSDDLDVVFSYFKAVDERFSTYKPNSEISKINRGLPRSRWSHEMTKVLELCEQTKFETGGYFDICRGGQIDPSGLVKGWAIQNAAGILRQLGAINFFIDAGGDIQTSGRNAVGEPWKVGIRNPFNRFENVKVIETVGGAVATSGTYIRGEHVYNPRTGKLANEVISLTVTGPNIFDADRFATAAFAMGRVGIEFIESLPGFEGYMIDAKGVATMTTRFAAEVPVC